MRGRARSRPAPGLRGSARLCRRCQPWQPDCRALQPTTVSLPGKRFPRLCRCPSRSRDAGRRALSAAEPDPIRHIRRRCPCSSRDAGRRVLSAAEPDAIRYIRRRCPCRSRAAGRSRDAGRFCESVNHSTFHQKRGMIVPRFIRIIILMKVRVAPKSRPGAAPQCCARRLGFR